MKKVFSLILALAICIMLINAVADETSPVGTWYIGSAQSDGTEIRIVDPEAITLTVNEDHTFALTAMGNSTPGTWTFADSAITLTPDPQEGAEAQEPIVFTLEGDDLLYDIGTAVVHLSRTPAEPAALSPAMEAVSADAFDGTWMPVGQITYGLYETTDETRSASLLIENGKVTMLYADNGKMIPYGEYEAAFTDGILTAEDTSFGSTAMTLSLREDSSLFFRSVTDFGTAKLDLTNIYVRAEFEIASDKGNEAESEGASEEESLVIDENFNSTYWESGDLKLTAVWQDGDYKIAIQDGETELSYLCEMDMETGRLNAIGTGVAEFDEEQPDHGRGVFFINEEGNLVRQDPEGNETVFTRIIDPLDGSRWYGNGKELTIFWRGDELYDVQIEQTFTSWYYLCELDEQADALTGTGLKTAYGDEEYNDANAKFVFSEGRTLITWTDDREPEAQSGLTFEIIDKALTQDFWSGENDIGVMIMFMDGYYDVHLFVHEPEEKEYAYLCTYDRGNGMLVAADPATIDFESLTMYYDQSLYTGTATFVMEDDDHMTWHDDNGASGDGIVLTRNAF